MRQVQLRSLPALGTSSSSGWTGRTETHKRRRHPNQTHATRRLPLFLPLLSLSPLLLRLVCVLFLLLWFMHSLSVFSWRSSTRIDLVSLFCSSFTSPRPNEMGQKEQTGSGEVVRE